MSLRDELPNLYGVLEVSTSATFDEIEAAYERIQQTLGGNGLALYSIIDEEDTDSYRVQVDSAYRTLSNPERRSEYDRHLRGESDYPPLTVAELDAVAATDTVSEPESPASDGPPPLSEPVAERVAQAKPKLRRLQPRLGEFDLGPDTEYSGDLLRRIRESAGATLAQVAEITKIGRGYLRAIEANDFDMLPAPVYVRGFVVEYARVLGLDSEQVVSSFMTLYERFREGGR